MAHQGQCSGQVSLNLANLDFQGLTRFLSQGLLNAHAHDAKHVLSFATQSRSQSSRYPCPAERENEQLWENPFRITGFLLFPVKLRRREVLIDHVDTAAK